MRKIYLSLAFLCIVISSLWSQTLIVDPNNNSPYTITGTETYESIIIESGGVLTIESTGVLEVDSMVIRGNSLDSTAIHNKGFIHIKQNQESGYSNIINAEEGTYTISGDLQLGIKDNFINNGTLNVQNINLTMNSSASSFSNFGTINIGGDFTYAKESVFIDFINSGTLNINGNLVVTGRMHTFINNNIINVIGNSSFDKDVFITITFSSGSRLNCHGNITFNADVTMSSNSYVYMDGYNTSINGSVSPAFSNLILDAYYILCYKTFSVKDTLFLKDTKLMTYSENVIILNTNENAIQRGTGYIFGSGSLIRNTDIGKTYIYPVGAGNTYYPFEFIRGTVNTGEGRLAVKCTEGTKHPTSLVDSICSIDETHYYTIGGFSKSGEGDTLNFFSDYTWNRIAYSTGSKWMLCSTSDSITPNPYHVAYWDRLPNTSLDYVIAQYRNQGISDTTQTICQSLTPYQIKTEGNIPGTKIVFDINPKKEGGATITSTGLFTPKDTGTYYISITGDNCFIKDHIYIYIALNPSCTITPNPGNICKGFSENFSVAGTNGDSFTYQWQLSEDGTNYTDITENGTSSTYHTQDSMETGTYFYRVLTTNNYGCSAFSDTTTLTIHPNPIIDFITPVTSDTTVCNLQPVDFTTTVSIGTNFTYKWQRNELVNSDWIDKTYDTLNFNYTGNIQRYIVPFGIDEINMEVWGAQGGYRGSSTFGGKGGYSKGSISVNAGDTLYIVVGGSGNSGGTSGGYNGGGTRASYAGGGGATHIATKSGLLPSLSSNQASVLIVAGGGGSDGAANKYGMYGGGTNGGSTSESYGTGGQGGTQIGGGNNGGSFGQGGYGYSGSSGYGGAGGGGWYGGGGVSPDGSRDDDRGGGGGSGYIGGVTNAQMIAGNATMPNPSGGTMTGREGNGYARIIISTWRYLADTTSNYTLIADDTSSFKVIVTNENGCKDTSRIVTVNVLPNPIVTLTPENSSSCVNDILDISATASVGNTFTYEWETSSDSINFTPMVGETDSFINTGALMATTYYKLTVTNENGCYLETPVIPIWVHENPVTQLITPINDTTVCEDRPILFTATATSGNSFTYQWQKSIDHTTYTNITAPLALTTYEEKPDTTADYRVVAINNFGCSTPSDTLQVNVNQKPDIAITPSSARSCIYNNDTLNAIAEAGVTIKWAPATDLTDIISTNPQIILSPTTTTTYTLIGTDAIGCQAFVDAVVTKDTLPNVVVTSTNHPGLNMCPGDTIMMKAKGAETYSWFPASGDSLYTETVNIPLEITTDYVLYSVNGNGCKDTTNITVTINPKPVSVINLPQLDTNVCEDNLLEMIAASNTGTNFSYQWQKSTDGVSLWNNIENATDSTYDLSVKDSLYYRHIVKNEYQCIDTSDILKVNVLYHPILTLEVPDTEICKNDSTVLTVHATQGNSFTYQWQKSLDNTTYTNIIGATNAVLNTGGLNEGTYFRVMVGNEYHCNSVPSEIQYITVRPNPIITILASGSDTTICAHYPFVLNTSTTGGNSFTYQWQKSTDNITYSSIDGATSTSYGENPEINTYYRMVVTNDYTCTNSSAIFEVKTLNNQAMVSNINDTSVCYGKEVHLILSGADIYSWSPSTYLSSDNSNDVTATPLSETRYIITGEHLNGCKMQDTIHLGVYNLPIITVTPPAPAIFKGDTAYLAAQGALTYQWTPADSIDSDVNESIKSYTQTTKTYTVVGTDIHGCQEDTTVTVTVYPKPIITITSPIATDTSVCEDNLIKLSVFVSGGDSYVYQWQESLNGVNSWNNIATANEATYIMPVQKTAFYRVQVYNNFSANDSSNVVKINMIPKPIVNITSQDTAICAGTSSKLNSTYSIGTIFTYQWLNSTDNLSYNNIIGQTNDSIETTTLNATTYYKLQVTNENGCATLSDPLTLIVHPNPNITSSINDTTICANEPLTISTSILGGNNFTYQWQKSTDKITYNDEVGITQDSLTTNPTDTVYYRVIVTNNFVCTSTSHDISVNSIDNPIITITPNAVKSCRLSPDTLVATGGVTYQWEPAEGLNVTSGNTVVATVANNTTYTVSSIGGNGCKSSSSVSLTKDTIPVITITQLSNTICKQSSTQLSAQGANTYSWHPIASLDVNNTQIVNASPTETTTYTAIGTDNNGCADSATVSVAVTERPDITIIHPTKDTSVCLDMPVLLSSNTVGVTPFDYQWQESLDGNSWQNIAGATLADYNFKATTVKYYRVIVSNRYDCSDTSLPRKVELNIQSALNIIPDKTFLCSGDNTTLRIQINGGISYSYQWLSSETGITDSYSDIPTATASTYPTGTLTQTKYYKVRITNNEGCVSLSDANEMTVYENPTVAIYIPKADTTICQADTILLAAGGALNYSWSPATELISTNKDSIYAYSSDTITYYVVGTDEHGCINKDTVTINVNQRPTITITPVTQTVCKNMEARMEAGGGVSYKWIPNDDLNYDNRAKVIAEPQATTVFTVTGTDANNCKNTATARIEVIPFQEVTVDTPPESCETTDSIFLTASMAGGEWIGTGIINSSLGIFSPSLAGPGTHSVNYRNTTQCPSADTIYVKVAALNKPVISTTMPEHQCIDSYLEPVNLQATPSGGTWTNNGNVINPNKYLVISGENRIIYALNNFCSGSDTILTYAHPIDTATITTTKKEYCSETNLVKLTVQTTQDDGGLWSGYKINPSTGLLNLADVYSGKYTYVYTPKYCPASDSISITVYPSTIPDILTLTTELCFNQNINLDATPTGGYWTVDGNQIAGNIFVPYKAGSHEIVYQMPQSCSHTDTIHIYVKDTVPTSLLSGYRDTICKSNEPITFSIKDYSVFYAVDNALLPSGVYYPTSIGTHVLNYYIFGNDSICQMSENKSFKVIDTIYSQILTQDLVLCSNSETVKFEAYPPNGLWYGSGMNIDGWFTPNQVSGTYPIYYTPTTKCATTSNTNVTIIEMPAIEVSTTEESCNQKSDAKILINVPGNGPYHYVWGHTTLDTNYLTNLPAGTYNVSVYFDERCPNIESIILNNNPDYCDDNIFIPNIFYPFSSNYENSIVRVYGKIISEFIFTIYDRYGHIVFKSRNQDEYWDGTYQGKLMESGVYFYTLEALLRNGESYKTKGNITLVK